jgi:hypothetical protein
MTITIPTFYSIPLGANPLCFDLLAGGPEGTRADADVSNATRPIFERKGAHNNNIR